MDTANTVSFVLSLSDIIQIIGIVAALVPSIVAIVISLVTMRQTKKIFEENSRAVISVYYQTVNTGNPYLYLLIKNFGHSPAVLQKISCNFDLSTAQRYDHGKDFLKDLPGTTFAPGQSFIICIDYNKIPDSIHFDVEYLSVGEKYHDEFDLRRTSFIYAPASKTATPGKELNSISYTLQEMLQKNL